jgi:HEAT repeat protein
MSSPDAVDPQPVESKRPNDPHLPPVEAPTAAFIMQLFLIPLVIVTIVVLLWLSFSWLAQSGRSDPKKLIAELRRGTDVSWQSGYNLAEMLRTPDPRYDALRQDHELAKELVALVESDMAHPLKGGGNKDDIARLRRRMFLCRAIGAFSVLDGAPLLAKLANQEKDPAEVSVRLSALEGLATLARNAGPEELRKNPAIMQAVLDASRAYDDSPGATKASEDGVYQPRSEVRAVAAFTLGVIGGDQARERLKVMLDDPYASARYNAATGLCRAGDEAAIRVLKEMLSPDNDHAAKDENTAADKDRKRIAVLVSGIQATMTLAEHNKTADLQPLIDALKKLSEDPLTGIKSDRTKIQALATEAYRRLK